MVSNAALDVAVPHLALRPAVYAQRHRSMSSPCFKGTTVQELREWLVRAGGITLSGRTAGTGCRSWVAWQQHLAAMPGVVGGPRCGAEGEVAVAAWFGRKAGAGRLIFIAGGPSCVTTPRGGGGFFNPLAPGCQDGRCPHAAANASWLLCTHTRLDACACRSKVVWTRRSTARGSARPSTTF